VLEGGGNEFAVQYLVQPRIGPGILRPRLVPGLLGPRRWHGQWPCLCGPVGVGQQVARDPEQPWPDGPVIGAQLRQVTPGPDEGFLHDVISARPVWAKPLDVAMQGAGVMKVQLADRGISVAGWLAARNVRGSRHVYYHE
jgi:hypothetical protein